MKKLFSVILAFLLCAGLAACTSPASSSGAAGPSSLPQAQGGSSGAAGDAAKHSSISICMISDPIGAEQFIKQAYDELAGMAEEYGFKWANVEVADVAGWEENSRNAAQQNYDLIVGVGWQAAEPFSVLADEFPNTKFAVIDASASNTKVKSINFNTAEGCYVLGAMIGTAFPEETLFGYVCNFQNQASFQYRYGFSEGVKSVLPEAQFVYNYVNSFSDTSLVHELAVQQRAAGCTFIFGGVSNSANSGIYQAALELADKGTPIYTTGLSVDQTTQDNPYIIGGVLKDTAVCMRTVVEEFLSGDFTGGVQMLGIKEKAFGVVGITTDEYHYRNTDIVTDEVLQAGKNAAKAISDGSLVIEVPQEADAK